MHIVGGNANRRPGSHELQRRQPMGSRDFSLELGNDFDQLVHDLSSSSASFDDGCSSSSIRAVDLSGSIHNTTSGSHPMPFPRSGSARTGGATQGPGSGSGTPPTPNRSQSRIQRRLVSRTDLLCLEGSGWDSEAGAVGMASEVELADVARAVASLEEGSGVGGLRQGGRGRAAGEEGACLASAASLARTNSPATATTNVREDSLVARWDASGSVAGKGHAATASATVSGSMAGRGHAATAIATSSSCAAAPETSSGSGTGALNINLRPAPARMPALLQPQGAASGGGQPSTGHVQGGEPLTGCVPGGEPLTGTGKGVHVGMQIARVEGDQEEQREGGAPDLRQRQQQQQQQAQGLCTPGRLFCPRSCCSPDVDPPTAPNTDDPLQPATAPLQHPSWPPTAAELSRGGHDRPLQGHGAAPKAGLGEAALNFLRHFQRRRGPRSQRGLPGGDTTPQTSPDAAGSSSSTLGEGGWQQQQPRVDDRAPQAPEAPPATVEASHPAPTPTPMKAALAALQTLFSLRPEPSFKGLVTKPGARTRGYSLDFGAHPRSACSLGQGCSMDGSGKVTLACPDSSRDAALNHLKGCSSVVDSPRGLSCSSSNAAPSAAHPSGSALLPGGGMRDKWRPWKLAGKHVPAATAAAAAAGAGEDAVCSGPTTLLNSGAPPPAGSAAATEARSRAGSMFGSRATSRPGSQEAAGPGSRPDSQERVALPDPPRPTLRPWGTELGSGRVADNHGYSRFQAAGGADRATALSERAAALGERATALGERSTGLGEYTMALGERATAMSVGGVVDRDTALVEGGGGGVLQLGGPTATRP